jgi:hypothetical protein
MRNSKPSLEYLTTCSQTSLEAFELSRYNRVANLRKQLRDLVEEWIDAEVDARLARWIRDQKQAALSTQTATAVSVPDYPRLFLADVLSHVLPNRTARPPSRSPLEESPFLATGNYTVAAFCRSADNFALLPRRASVLPAPVFLHSGVARSFGQLHAMPQLSRPTAHFGALLARTH